MPPTLTSKPTLQPRTVLGAALLALWLSGCGPGGGTVRESPPADQQARQLMASGNHAAAAREYLRMLQQAERSNPGAVPGLRAAAANALLSADDAPGARAALSGLPARGLAADVQAMVDLAAARLALLDGEPEQALALLPPSSALDTSLQRAHAETRVGILSRVGAPLEVVRARAELDALLIGADERAANRRALWTALGNATPAALASVRTGPPDAFGGWLELGEIARSVGADADALQAELLRWRQRYPGHPGDAAIAMDLLSGAQSLSGPADRVTLLLPLSGRFGAAGGAVREGFIAAWLQRRGGDPAAAVQVIDTERDDPVSAYQRAVQNGAQFIVGPLRKEAVTALLAGSDLSVPTLVLNVADIASGPGARARPATLFEMALSPEQEAEQTAERIWFDGHATVAVIGPSGDWGERVVAAFSAAFQGLGGHIVESQRFDPEARDLSEPVQALLNIDESEARHRALRTQVGADLEFEVRRRQDIDAIFMPSFPNQARLLRPQLRFHRAAQVPAYATSHVYTGVPDPGADRDIDGVTFGDMPWMLDASMVGDPLRQQLSANFPEAMAGYARLFALGADAAGLAGQLGRLKGQRSGYDGYTGELYINADNVVERRLRWARFVDGVPQSVTNGLAPSAPDAGFFQ